MKPTMVTNAKGFVLVLDPECGVPGNITNLANASAMLVIVRPDDSTRTTRSCTVSSDTLTASYTVAVGDFPVEGEYTLELIVNQNGNIFPSFTATIEVEASR